METMESSASVSSRESLYSFDSAASEEEEEEQQRCGDFEVFLSDSGSDVEKEAIPPRHRRDAYPDRRAFLFAPGPGRANAGLLRQDHKRRMRKPLGLLAAARLRPTGSCCQYPMARSEAYCAHLMDADKSLPRQVANQGRMESGGRKRLSSALGGGPGRTHVPPPSRHGVKRQRNVERDARQDPRSPCWTEGDHVFAQKCRELQGFVRPLIELLNRLKTGRFDRGLSSFQQSVAMDRIQRIIGVLQKPEMGERYLGTLLQVERMLKVWFPHVALKSSRDARDAAVETVESSAGENIAEKRAASLPDLVPEHPAFPASPDTNPSAPSGEPARFLGNWPAMNLTWIHTAPISNPPLGHVDLGRVNSAFGQALLGPHSGAYGVVVFLQNNPDALGPFGRATSLTSVHTSPTCCHSSTLLPGSAEHPRCRSLPGPTIAGSHLDRGTLGGLSKSLPHLPISSEGREMAHGTPAHHSNS
ncbi:circadian-associated transcriptional repressor isoform X2 [Elgaria multicarinata webbii]|uniref:circadian-associated transcriptional repressor isoform X2 n=1 Tax=Elgaria multicarinata webbii TaxID=159646 RepID=UPI002FCD07C3